MINKLVQTIVVFVIVACHHSNEKKEVVEYFPDGEVKSIKEFSDGKFNGFHKVYYENGRLQFLVNYEDSLMNGSFVSFYDNGNIETEYFFTRGQRNGKYKRFYSSGNLKERGTYENDFLRGEVLKYFDKEGTMLKSKEVFVQYGDKTVLMAFEKYDSLGNLIENLPLPYNVSFPFGDLKKGVTYEVEVSITRKKNDSLRLILGDFTTDFNLNDNKSDTIYPTGNKFKFSFRPIVLGKNVFRVLVEDFKVADDSIQKTELINNKFIEIEYEVDLE